MQSFERLVVDVPTANLKKIFNPYIVSPWVIGSWLTRKEVKRCLAEKVFEDAPNIVDYTKEYDPKNNAYNHSARVAWLLAKGWRDPIELDFGLRSRSSDWHLIVDGNHRFAAAIYRKDKYISAEISGDLEWASLQLRIKLEDRINSEFSILAADQKI